MTRTPHPIDPAQADARFAEYVADLRTGAGQSGMEGQECRELLAKDPQTLRALFDLAEAVARPSEERLSYWAWLLILAVVTVLLADAVVLGRVIA